MWLSIESEIRATTWVLMVSDASPEEPAVVVTAEAFFAERKGRANVQAALKFLSRKGGEPPRAGDELPN